VPYSAYPAQLLAAPARQPARVRTWYAVLTLYFLAPMTGEMLSGSTPPVQFINPASLLIQAALYGTGALLVRELTRRRGLSWSSLLWLGAAYGILEEGLVVTSWFNPYWPDIVSLGNYGRLLGLNWSWALGLTIYHAVVSISVPIILAAALFPRIADRPWLGRKGFAAALVGMGVVWVVELLLFGFALASVQSKGAYMHPPASYLIALALFAGCVWLGLRRPRRRETPPEWPAPFTTMAGGKPAQRVPRLRTLRTQAFLAAVAFFFLTSAAPNLIAVALVQILIVGAYAALAAWQLRRWGARPCWGPRQRLALAGGIIFFFVLVAPLLEFAAHLPDKNMTGMTVAAVGWLVLVIVLSRRARATEQALTEQALAPAAPSGPR
jgi:hypothetical protein